MRRLTCAGVVALAVLAGGCSSTEAEPADRPAPTSRTQAASEGELAVVDGPVDPGAEVHGLVTVGDHRLAVHCEGAGDPTVMILHGWIDEAGVTSYDYYGSLRKQLTSDFRVCSYDRANVGDSEQVRGTQNPPAVVADLKGVLDQVSGRSPVILVGQSAGGMVASAFAVAHPDDVAGIVMLDASFDEEITIEDVGMVPPGVGPCDPENRRLDGQQSLQMIDNCAMYRWAYGRREDRPQVPLAYLAARQEPWSGYTELGSRWTRRIVPLQKSYAASWSPGRFQWVDSGHDIHAEKPAAVAAAVRWVVSKGNP